MSEMDVMPVEPDMTGNTPPAEPEPSPFSVTEDQWNELTSTNEAMRQWIEQQAAAQYQQPQQGGPAPFDIWAEDAGEVLGERLARIEALLGNQQAFHQRLQYDESQSRGLDIIDNIVSRDGEFMDGERAVDVIQALAPGLYDQIAAERGEGYESAERAYEQAAAFVRELEKSVRERAIAQHTNALSTLAGSPGEPGSEYMAGAQTRTMPDYRQGGSVTDRMFSGGS